MISRYLGGLWLLLAIAGAARATAQQAQGPNAPPEPPNEPLPYVPPSRTAHGPPRSPNALPNRAPDPQPPPSAEPRPGEPINSWSGRPEGTQDPASDTRVPSTSPFPPAPPPHVPPSDPYVTPDAAASSAPPEEPPPQAEPTPPPLTAEIPTTPIGPPPPAADTRRRVQAAIMLGMGTTFDHTLGGVNPLGFGFGVRGSYHLLPRLTVGGRVVYFIGGSSDLPTGRYSMQSWLLAGEAAYPVELDGVLFQPGVAFGILFRDSDGRPGFIGNTGGGYVTGSSNRTEAGMYISPGLDVVFPLTLLDRDLELFFLGGDTRLDVVFGSSVSANVQLLIQGGLRF